MKEIVFALEFKGSAGPLAGAADRLQARTSATGQTLHSLLKPDGVQASVEPAGGDSATFESEVEVGGAGMFVESGRIRYGAAGTITFKTVGRGVLGPSPVTGIQRGAVIWEITGGDGRFRGAHGLITSNFTVGAEVRWSTTTSRGCTCRPERWPGAPSPRRRRARPLSALRLRGRADDGACLRPARGRQPSDSWRPYARLIRMHD